MTCYPIPENHDHWWLTTAPGWRRLHAIPGGALTVEDHRNQVDYAEPNLRTADIFEVVEVGSTSWLSALTKAQLWRIADVLTVPGIDDATRLNLVQGIKGERASRKPAPMLPKILAETGASNVVGILKAA